jgi:hypothetical protein
MANELPMIEAPALSIIFLLLGAVGLLREQLAVNLALANGVAQLLIWGIVVARRLGWSWFASILAGAVDASSGVVIIVLKALLH